MTKKDLCLSWNQEKRDEKRGKREEGVVQLSLKTSLNYWQGIFFFYVICIVSFVSF